MYTYVFYIIYIQINLFFQACYKLSRGFHCVQLGLSIYLSVYLSIHPDIKYKYKVYLCIPYNIIHTYPTYVEGFPLFEWVLNTYNSSQEIICILAGLGTDIQLPPQAFADLPCHLLYICLCTKALLLYLRKHCVSCTASMIIGC